MSYTELKFEQINSNPYLKNTDRFTTKNGFRFYTQSTDLSRPGMSYQIAFVALPKIYDHMKGRIDQEFIFEVPFLNTLSLAKKAKNINDFFYYYGIHEFRDWLSEIDIDKPNKVTFALSQDSYKDIEINKDIILPPLDILEEERLDNIAENTILKLFYYNKEGVKYDLDYLKEKAFVPDKNFTSTFNRLIEQGYINMDDYKLTKEGTAYYKNNNLANNNPNIYSKTVFVAQSFKEEILDVYYKVYEPVIKSFKLNPVIILKEEPDNNIDDEILNQIRQCRFLICDLTYERPSVYFEAGYTLGIGTKVFYTCRNDHNSDDPSYKPGGYKTHFDVRNRKITFWNKDKLKEFGEELSERIKQFLEQPK